MTTPVGAGPVARQAWSDLGQEPGWLELLTSTRRRSPPGSTWGGLAVDSVGVASLAAQLLLAGTPPAPSRPGAGPRWTGGRLVRQRPAAAPGRTGRPGLRPAVRVLAGGRRLGPHPRQLPAPLPDSADVVLLGYRPGSLDRFGLAPAELAARHPGTVVGTVSAWGLTGPWAARRGFDSLVQAACGIAVTESRDGATPGALPVQALDHASGHLLAAGVACAVRDQSATGGSHAVAMALARTAAALPQLPRSDRGWRPGPLVVAGPVTRPKTRRIS